MRIAGKPLVDFGYSDVESLVTESVREDMHIEYKEELHGTVEQDRREFLRDVSAFANKAGGTIIYGVAEKRDSVGKPTGEPERVCGMGNVNRDQAKLRIESSLRSSLSPGYTQPVFHFVGEGENTVLLLGIPRSFSGPHMVGLDDGRFWTRTSSGKSKMDVTELRRAFIEQSSWKKTALQFRDRRISEVWYGDSIPSLQRKYGLFIHVLRLGQEDEFLDIKQAPEHMKAFGVGPGGDWLTTFHLDGVRSSLYGKECRGYVQLFRDGSIEVFSTVPSEVVTGLHGEEEILDGLALDRIVVARMTACREVCTQLGIDGPFVLLYSVLGCGKRYLFANLTYAKVWRDEWPRFIDRDELLLAPIAMETWDDGLIFALQNTMNILWQAAGWPECDPTIQKQREDFLTEYFSSRNVAQ